MRHSTRLLLTLMVSALAAVALGSSPALAADEYIVESELLVTSAVATKGTSGLTLLASKVGVVELRLECKDDSLTGDLEALGKSTATIDMLGCAVTKPASCTTSSLITASVAGKLIGSEPIKDELKPGSGGTIAEITISGGACSVAGAYRLLGTQECELPHIDKGLVEHELVCKKSGSNLKLGTEAASLSTTEKTSLESKKLYGALEAAADVLEPVGGGTELSFVGLAAGAKKEIKAENIGFSTAYLKEEWIEEGGGRAEEGNFKIIAAAPGVGKTACNFPPNNNPFDVLNRQEACYIGVEFVSGLAGKNAKYVVNYSCFWGWFFCGKKATLDIKS